MEKLNFLNWQLQLYSDASIQFENASSLRVLSGKVFVSAKTGALLFPGMTYQLSDSELLVQIMDGHLQLRHLAGQGKIESQFLLDQQLPVGFENWFGAMKGSGKLDQGVARPFDVVETLKELKTFKTAVQIKDYVSAWKTAPDMAAEYYQQSVQKQISAAEVQQASQEKKVQEEQAERRELLRMFHERHAMDGQ